MLIDELCKNYNVRLVISSTWRANMEFTIKTLKDNGLIYDGKYDSTPISDPAKRGEQILEYLKNKTNYNFVIIDDEWFDFKQYFSEDKIIKTEMFHHSLSINQIKNYLKKDINLSK